MVASALFLSLFATICFGAATFLSSKSAKDMGSLQTLFFFQLLGLPADLLLLPFAPRTVHIDLLPIILVGLYMTVSMLVWFYALKVGNVSIVSPATESYSLLSVLLGIFFLHESVGILKGIGIILIFVGVLCIGLNFSSLKKSKRVEFYTGIPLAFLYAILLAVFYLFTTFLARTDGWFVTAFGLRVVIIIGSFVLLILQGKSFKQIFSHVPWAWIGAAGFLDGLGFSIFTLALTFSQVSYVAVIASTQSLVTVFLAYFFYKERLKLYQIVGLVGVIVGLIFLQLH
ncbi:MAG TPA: DMT family transporter [Patescibacteria group bacterium]|nr:DMT family transporter [Patescibacteria group bacterium]